MKKIALFLVMALVLSVVALMPASAETTDPNVAYGTPVLDGKMDDLYLKSGKITIVNDITNWGYGMDPAPFDGCYAYLLWDEDYLYIFCGNTNDTTPCIYDEDPAVKGDPSYNNWADDCAEIWFMDGSADGEDYKVHLAPDGTFFTGDGTPSWTGRAQIKGQLTDNGWELEAAIPVDFLEEGKEFQFKYQNNNIVDEFGSGVWAACCDWMTLTMAPKPAAPSTGDNALVAVIALVVTAGAALVISKKR